MEFKRGDVVIHKATLKRCVVKRIYSDGRVIVTTQDDETKTYSPEELRPYEQTPPK